MTMPAQTDSTHPFFEDVNVTFSLTSALRLDLSGRHLGLRSPHHRHRQQLLSKGGPSKIMVFLSALVP